MVWKTANLIYANQSGAIDESFADIFGTAVEFYSGVRPDYLVGEDVVTPGVPGDALRSLANPPLYGQPDHLGGYFYTIGDNGGGHTNSGIQNKAFYLLAVGGTHRTSGITVSGIGRPAAEWIFFRALRKLSAGATFADVRRATLSAAADGYGPTSNAYYQTARAWKRRHESAGHGPQLDRYIERYLDFLGPGVAAQVAPTCTVTSPARLREVIREIADLGGDEIILVPTAADPGEVDRVADLMT